MQRSFAYAFTLSLACWLCAPDFALAYTINTTEVGKRIRWSQDTVALRIDPALEGFLAPGDTYAALQMSLEAWRGLPRVPDLLLRAGTPPAVGHHGGEPSNGVYLLADWPYEREKLAVTIITYEMNSGRLLDADIVVNGEARFALLDERGRHEHEPQHEHYDLAAVLTHEVGHLLGLGESEDPVATMWPYAAPGETDKRLLADDDEAGVIESYLSAPPAPASGCGSSSVHGRAGTPGSLWIIALLLGALSARRIGRASVRRCVLALPAIAAALLLGFGEPVRSDRDGDQHIQQLEELRDTLQPGARALLMRAAKDAVPDARLRSMETLARIGTRDDRGLAEQLCSDADARVAARAQQTLGLLLARPPSRVASATTDESRARLSTLMAHGSHAIVGRAHKRRMLTQDGLFFTEYAVRDARGQESVLRVPGGEADGIAQRVLHGEPPPASEHEVLVVPQPDGSQRWAYHHQGQLFGGHLGDGAAIAGAL